MRESDQFSKIFEDLVSVAESPEDFERYRQSLLDQVISSFPEARQERMRRFQWRIDQERRKHANPVGSLVAMSEMMWKSFSSMQEQLQILENALQDGSVSGELSVNEAKAEVIPLRA